MILMLDFDGTTHPRVTSEEPLFCRLPLIEQWLREHRHVDVVISSSWREVHPFDEMQSYFSDDLQHRIVGVTPIANKLVGKPWSRTPEEVELARYERQFEIERWVAQSNHPMREWVALDDDERLFEPDCQHLVLCDPRRGVMPGNIFTLTRKLLQSQPYKDR